MLGTMPIENQIDSYINTTHSSLAKRWVIFLDVSSLENNLCKQICLELETMGFPSIIIPIDGDNTDDSYAFFEETRKYFQPDYILYPCRYLLQLENKIREQILSCHVPIIGYWYADTHNSDLSFISDLLRCAPRFKSIITNQLGVSEKRDNVQYIGSSLSLLSMRQKYQSQFLMGKDDILILKAHNEMQQMLLEKLQTFFTIVEKNGQKENIIHNAKMELIFHQNLIDEACLQDIITSILQKRIVLLPHHPLLEKYFSIGQEVIAFNGQSELFSAIYALQNNLQLNELIKRKAISRVINHYTINSAIRKIVES